MSCADSPRNPSFGVRSSWSTIIDEYVDFLGVSTASETLKY
jgi:hypothetical protein